MKIKEIINYLEELVPLSIQESYDNSGLIIGSPEQNTLAALISLDCTEEVVQEAIDKKINLIVSHHPIIFSGLKKITGKNYVEKTIIKAIQNNIAIYALHTNLDNFKNGVSFKMAEKLSLKNVDFLFSKTELTGSGIIGELNQELNENDFLNLVKKSFSLPILKHTSFNNKKVKKIALCGGSGSFLLQEAIKQKVDVFISSDFKYHQFFDAENQIVIVDIGHFEAEFCSRELIYEILTKKFPTFTLHFSEVNTNPVKYF